MNAKDIALLNGSILFLFGFIGILYQLLKRSRNSKYYYSPVHTSWSFILCLVVVLMIALYPAELSFDKMQYKRAFEDIAMEAFKEKDIGWYYYNYFLSILFSNTTLYFIVTASIYVYANYSFVRFNSTATTVYLLLSPLVASLGFIAYGMNTTRAGFALSMILLGMTQRGWKRVLFFCFALTVHKSVMIIIGGYILTTILTRRLYYYLFWTIALLITSLNIAAFADYIKENFSEIDERLVSYMESESNELYAKSGFRMDFLIYSMVPILFSGYLISKKGFKESTYIQLANLYLLVNSFWLIVIRVPYADRFAYLSWFLIPYLIIYPLLKKRMFINQYTVYAVAALYIILLPFALMLISY